MIPFYKRFILVYLFRFLDLLLIAIFLFCTLVLHLHEIFLWRVCFILIWAGYLLLQFILVLLWSRCPHCRKILWTKRMFHDERILMCPHCKKQVEIQ